MQVVPIGTKWASRTYFERPARVLGLEYVEYSVEVSESSLGEEYGRESLVVKKPEVFKEWKDKRKYLKEQNVRLDVVRFRKCLEHAYQKAITFMGRERELIG